MEESEIKKPNKFITGLWYALIGIAASLSMALLFYWGLRLNSNIASLISNTKNAPAYLWPYAILTFGTIILFGINASLFTFRWRKFGPPHIKTQTGNGLGSLTGIVASACPVCGSTILASIGIAAGLAAFPLKGLELKTASFALMTLSFWLTARDIKDPKCKDGICPTARDASFNSKDRDLLMGTLILILVFSLSLWNMLKTDPLIAIAGTSPETTLRSDDPSVNAIIEKVIPSEGFRSKISLSDAAVKLAEEGIIDKKKFYALYESRGGLPSGMELVLQMPSLKTIHLTQENAGVYLNVLWPLGIANYMSSNAESPVNGSDLFNFASTGGWTLGKEENGGAYFNKFKLVNLTPDQEVLATKVAKNTYRPCCGNSTFFQDCNHGSALLGLLELGASQGLSEDELYEEALRFNSFWFPDTYIKTALYFKVLKNTDWENINPRTVMGKEFSSIRGWSQNVQQPLEEQNLLPQIQSGAGCGV